MVRTKMKIIIVRSIEKNNYKNNRLLCYEKVL